MPIEHIRNDSVFPKGFERTLTILSQREPVKEVKLHLLLSQPRTGSTLVSDYITKTGDLGWCDEWLNPVWIDLVAKKTGTSDLSKNLKWTLRHAASPDGSAAINIQLPQLLHWAKKQKPLPALPSRLIYLTRNNRLEQAFSLAKARSTKIFQQVTPVKEQPSVQVSNLSIATALRDICYWHEIAEKFLMDRQCLRMSYEAFSNNPMAINEVLKFFGSTRDIDSLPKSNLSKQQSPQDVDNLRRFCSEMGFEALL